MGFRPKLRTFKLVFPEDHQLHGLEIEAHSLPFKRAKEMLVARAITNEEFIECVISWNLEDPETGDPLKIHPDSLDNLEAIDLRQLKQTWFDNCIGKVDDFLEPKSADGELSEVASLPMENL